MTKVREGSTYVMGAGWYNYSTERPMLDQMDAPRVDIVIVGHGDWKQVIALLLRVPEEHRHKVEAFLLPFKYGEWPMRTDGTPHIGTYETRICIWWKQVTECLT